MTSTPLTDRPALPIIGLIGGMGAGKSTLAAELSRTGGHVLSGDQFGHEALRQPSIRDQVVARWGATVLGPDHEIDRRALGRLVFANEVERRALERLSFPWIERRFREEITAGRGNGDIRFLVLDAALLLEAGWNRLCDWIVYLHTPRADRLARLARQRGWTEEEVLAREAAQLTLTEKVSRADVAIDNSGSPDQLARQVDRLLRLLGHSTAPERACVADRGT